MVCHTDVEYLVLGSTGTRVGTNRLLGKEWSLFSSGVPLDGKPSLS